MSTRSCSYRRRLDRRIRVAPLQVPCVVQRQSLQPIDYRHTHITYSTHQTCKSSSHRRRREDRGDHSQTHRHRTQHRTSTARPSVRSILPPFIVRIADPYRNFTHQHFHPPSRPQSLPRRLSAVIAVSLLVIPLTSLPLAFPLLRCSHRRRVAASITMPPYAE